jgi:uncharacterized protein (DUF433 family)
VSAPRIISDPKILFGKPVIAGTRISAELILEKLADGDSVSDLLVDYPHITEADIRAVLKFAVQTIRNDVVVPIAMATV